jgi:hypothetical protein
VLFGMPAAGKSSLLGALGQAAQSQEHLLNGHLVDVSHGLAELRQRLYDENARRTAEEVVPYPVDFEPFADGKHEAKKEHVSAEMIDCDGRVANDLLVRRRALDQDSPEGSLAREVVGADTLVLVIDASAPEAQIDADFAEFDRFLHEMERSRGRGAEVGGLPVFLVLTKCDLLARPGDTTVDWMEHIEQRKRDVDKRFRDFLHRRAAAAATTTGSLPFGRIELHLWATAIKRPALANSPAKAREPYGVAELFRQCLEQAAEFRRRREKSRRRLTWTVGVAVGLVGLLVVLAVVLFFHNREGRRIALQDEAENVLYPLQRPTPAERLRGSLPELRARLDRLTGIRNNPQFGSLTERSREEVEARLAELKEYIDYLEKLQEARQPATVRSEDQLREVREALQTNLALPHPEWAETAAGQLRAERLKETEALRKAVQEVVNWYQDGLDRVRALWTFGVREGDREEPGIDWQAWQADVDKLLDPARMLPFKDTDPIPGTSLTYAAALRFDRVVELRADWEREKKRLEHVRSLTAALGLIAGGKERPPVLVVPAKGDFSLDAARGRLAEMERAYPDYRSAFVLAEVPDAIRPLVRKRARANYDNLLEPARDAVLKQLQQGGSGTAETPARWDAVQKWLKDPQELASWRVLALALLRLDEADPVDPVSALASFLRQTSFPITLRGAVLEIPDALKVKPSSSGALAIYHAPSGTDKPVLKLELQREDHDARRRVTSYTYRRTEGESFAYKPGDVLWAELPLRDGETLSWLRSRSAVFQFERLLREPRRHRSDEKPLQGKLEEDVHLLPSPPDGVPRVPDLVPAVRLGGR